MTGGPDAEDLRLAIYRGSGRLEHGYQRRDPGQAGDYLRGAELSGSFWGL